MGKTRRRGGHAAFCGAALLSLLAAVLGGCDEGGGRPAPGDGSGGSGGSTQSESGGESQGGRIATGGSAASGGAASANGGAAATGSRASTETGGRSADGGAGQGTGGAPSASGGAATGGALASGGTGGASEPDAGECKYAVPVVEGGPVCTSSVCRSASGYEIRVSTPGGFYVGHLVWILATCDAQFYRSEHLDGAITTLRFLLTANEFAALPEHLPVSAFYGSPGSEPRGNLLMNCGTLTLSDPPACSP